MRLTVFNGSPRAKASTNKIILDHFIEGFMETEGNSYELAYLVRVKEADRFVEMFKEAEQVIIAFPLYYDSMPAIVKTFIESLEPFRGNANNPRIAFSVNSGFPEANHSRYVERYLKKLARRLGCEYIGTVVRGNMHRVDETPAWMTKKILKTYKQLGKTFGETGQFDQKILDKLAKPEKFTGFTLSVMKLMYKTPFASFGWDRQLKKAGSFDRRYARPYVG